MFPKNEGTNPAGNVITTEASSAWEEYNIDVPLFLLAGMFDENGAIVADPAAVVTVKAFVVI